MPLHVLWNAVEAVIDALYSRGFRRFICGGAMGFDTMAASVVLQKKRDGLADLSLMLALPCEDQAKGWAETDAQLYREIREQADRLIVLSPRYYPGCMIVRNRFMVDHAALCVAFLCTAKGGTAGTVRYAVREGLPVLNLAVADEVSAFLAGGDNVPLPF